MKNSLIFAVGMLLFCGSLHGDIFSLFPFRGRASAANPASVLPNSLLWTEDVNINGHSLELEVALVNRTLPEALRDLRGQFQKGAAAMNSNSLLFEVPLESGAKKRYYLVALKGIIPMLQFSLTLPRNFRNHSGVWPSELPLPPGALPQTVMRFPRRHSVYGVFSSPYPPQQTLADLTGNLERAGWKSMGYESRSSLNASGEVFLREKKQEILVISVQNAASGSGSSGSIYCRKLPDK